MAIEIIPGSQAFDSLYSNPVGVWPTRRHPERIQPIATPSGKARFNLTNDDTIFCIGSCFAREIETALCQLGFTVLSTPENLPYSPRRTAPDKDLLNKYNVATILNELRWVLDADFPYSHDSLVEMPGGLLHDYQLVGALYADEAIPARQFRETINALFGRIREASVVVITLGLSEVWFDRQTGLYLNRAPSKAVLAHYPGRFELHVLDYPETLAMLQDIHSLLTRTLSAGFRLLITVSPVPLSATFREQDVLTANTYSKSVLRAAVEQFVHDKENADYFPSYEFVILSNPDISWAQRDFRHVDEAFVEFIMASAMASYAPDTPGIRENATITRAMALYRSGHDAAALAALRSLDKLTNPRAMALAQAIRLRIPATARHPFVNAIKWLRPDSFRKLWRTLGHAIRSRAQSRQALWTLGEIENWDGEALTGWCLGNNKRPRTKVCMRINGREPIEVTADISRLDFAQVHGSGCEHCGFHVQLDLADADEALVHVTEAGTGRELHNSPFLISGRRAG